MAKLIGFLLNIATCLCCVFFFTATDAFAQDFIFGAESGGTKFKPTKDSELNVRVRLQPRFDFGELGASADQKSYETGTDLFLRRAGLEFNGKIIDSLRYSLVFEAGKVGSNSKSTSAAEIEIHNAFIDYRFSDEAAIRLGRGKLPYTRVLQTPATKLLFVERPSSTDTVRKLFNDYWQANIMLHGAFLGGSAAYNLMASDGWKNGDLLNGKDDKDGQVKRSDPLYMARVELSPPGYVEDMRSDAHFGKGRHVTLGLSCATQRSIDYSNVSGAQSNDGESRTFAGADLSAHLGGFTAQAEYLWWVTDYTRGDKNDLSPRAWYAQFGYFFQGPNIEPAVRYEYYDQDANTPGKGERNTTLGINWYLKGQSLKLSVNWIHSRFEDNASSNVKVKGAGEAERDFVQMQFQIYL